MYQFRDPVHGFIDVSDDELKSINSAPFQRLRNIHQLATTYLVYHGAEHTRFGHSIGVMHLTSCVFDSVTKKYHIFSLTMILRITAEQHGIVSCCALLA